MADKKMTMQGLGEIALGVLTLIVVYSVVPLIGSSMDTATTLGPTSQWNHTVNANIPTGVDLWTTVGPFLTLAAIILIVAGFLTTLKGLKDSAE